MNVGAATCCPFTPTAGGPRFARTGRLLPLRRDKIMKRPKSFSLKNNLLALLLCALMLPPVAVLLVAAFAHYSQERAMENAVSSYVQDLAESMAYRLSSNNAHNLESCHLSYAALHCSIFSLAPPIPGWVAYVNSEGQVVMSSPGTSDIAVILQEGFPVGEADTVMYGQGRQYTVAAHRVRGGGYVIAAVSWDELLGNLIWIGRLWPILIIFVSL